MAGTKELIQHVVNVGTKLLLNKSCYAYNEAYVMLNALVM